MLLSRPVLRASKLLITRPERTPNVTCLVSRPPSFHRTVVAAAAKKTSLQKNTNETKNLVFHPLKEAEEQLKSFEKAELSTPLGGFARVGYHDECEAAINDQINIEYSISYIYHSFYAYFDRDNVGLQGIAHYFRGQSTKGRNQAETLMQYQNKRGGRVKLLTIMEPEVEYSNIEKGEALFAFVLALSLKKLNYQKMWDLDHVATQVEDYELASFVEEMLHKQVDDVKEAAEQVAQLRRVGVGLGVYEFDKQLL